MRSVCTAFWISRSTARCISASGGLAPSASTPRTSPRRRWRSNGSSARGRSRRCSRTWSKRERYEKRIAAREFMGYGDMEEDEDPINWNQRYPKTGGHAKLRPFCFQTGMIHRVFLCIVREKAADVPCNEGFNWYNNTKRSCIRDGMTSRMKGEQGWNLTRTADLCMRSSAS